jgi:formamidopyrimidine-DNA glycosylase
MPELPEVEVTRQSFAERIRGARVTAIRVGKPLRWPLGSDAAAIVGQRVGEVSRRGKYLWLALEHGGLLLHLGMSGSLSFGTSAGVPGPHDHLRLTDPRRFGAVVWSEAADAPPASTLLAGLGLEPFDERFDGAYLHGALRRRRVSVKNALLGGEVVVGAGNIYACEALFEAGIDPRTRSDRISRPRAERLAEAVRRTLARAIELGGSTLRNFRNAHGAAGEFQLNAKVYGRAGKPCLRCGTPIRRVVQGTRATFFCPSCQRR